MLCRTTKRLLTPNLIIGQKNSSVLIGLAAIGNQPLYYAQEEAAFKSSFDLSWQNKTCQQDLLYVFPGCARVGCGMMNVAQSRRY